MSSTFICGQCHFECSYGAHVCRGCGGDIVYGATSDEKKQGRIYGAIIGVLSAGVILELIPSKVAGLFGTSASLLNVPSGAAFIVIGVLVGSYLVTRNASGKVRTFRRRRVS